MNTAYNYDSLSRLLSVLHQASGVTVDGATYTVDDAGNRTGKTNHTNNTSEQYVYDAIYQLKQVTQGGNLTEDYTYDPAGNRLSALLVSPYNYNASNQLTSTPQATFTYDLNGNTLTKVASGGTTAYAWSVEDELASVTLPNNNGVVTFQYDPFGRRIRKSSPAGVTIYVYDGDDLVAEYDGAGALVATYVHNEGIDEPLAMLRMGTLAYYHADGLGSVTSLTDATGTALAAYTYVFRLGYQHPSPRPGRPRSPVTAIAPA